MDDRKFTFSTNEQRKFYKYVTISKYKMCIYDMYLCMHECVCAYVSLFLFVHICVWVYL